MFNQYQPNVRATIVFLRELKVRVNSSTVNETLQNHPDWPSLLCISESLTEWHIPNGAGKISPSDFDQLPTPFITHMTERVNQAVIVTNATENTITYFSTDHNKKSTQSRDEFLKNWDGVYLIAEPNERSGEEKYKKNMRKYLVNSLVPFTLVALLILFSFFIFKITIDNQIGKIGSAGIYFQYFIQLAGIIITSLLLWYEIDANSPVLQKVCSGFVKGNCSAILTSKRAKVFSWLSWSEIGFFYFSGGFFLLLYARTDILNSISVVSWLNLIALPYTIFSIYYQWKVEKQWCVLCLFVQGLLLLGAANIFINSTLHPIGFLSIGHIITILSLYSLPALSWFTIKPFLLRLQASKNTKREYLRLKFDFVTFGALLKKQKTINASTDGLGIDLGNPNAENLIIKVCNPYCGPCAKAHPKIEKLLEKNTNVRLKIIFLTFNKKDTSLLLPVKHFLAINEKENRVELKKALDDWYLAKKKDYENFAKKYPMNGELGRQNSKIEAMDGWCKETKVQSTPTFFINGYQLPTAYSVEDLEYFLAE